MRKDIDRLEKVQRRATKMIEGLEGYGYLDRLRILGLTTLKFRHGGHTCERTLTGWKRYREEPQR